MSDNAVYRLGSDFSSGDTVRYVVPLFERRSQQSEQTPPLGLAVEGLDSPLVVESGQTVSFRVTVTNALLPARLSVFADVDTSPASGNEIRIFEGPAVASQTITWDTTGAVPGAYLIYAEVQDASRFVRSRSAGQVRILPALQIVFQGLARDTEVDVGKTVEFDVLVENVLRQVDVSVFAQSVNGVAGPSFRLVSGTTTRAFHVAWNTGGVPEGTYAIYAEARENGRFVRSSPARGRVVILQQLALAIVGLDEDRVVTQGQIVSFRVTVAGARPGATLSVFADPGPALGSGHEIFVAGPLPAEPNNAILWDTTDTPPGRYTLYADLRDGRRTARSIAAGAIHILEAPICPGDVDGDRDVDLDDLTVLLTQFDATGATLPGDLSGNGVVDLDDLTLLLTNFDSVCR